MFMRLSAALTRLCMAASLVALGTTALGIIGTTPAAASSSTDGIFGWGSTPALEALPAGVTPTAVAAGQMIGYAIGSDGNLYAWPGGPNYLGELGDGNAMPVTDAPVVVSLPAGVTPTAIAGGFNDGYAIGSDGNLYAWGWNGQGELGIGNDTGPDACPANGPGGSPGPTVPCATTPVRVALPAGVSPTAIATSGETESQPSAVYAIGSDGKLYAWGDNGSGQLGDGNTNESDTPVVVSLPSGVTPTAIAGGDQDGYAIGSDGNLYAWGDNSVGELGNGTTTSSSIPVPVSLPAGVTPEAIAGGGAADLGGTGYLLDSDGNLYAWGYNGDGALGDGTTTGPDTCTIALTFPQSGTESFPCSTGPVQVSLPSGVTATAIAGNGVGGFAIGSNSHIYSWGDGELGDGSSGGSDTPVVVSLPTGGIPVSLSQGPSTDVSYAIVDAPPVAPAVTTQPTSQSVYAGEGASFTAAASGYPAPTVQWEVSTDGGTTFSPVPGATSDTLSIGATTVAENDNEYEATFTNGSTPATTHPATLTVNPDVKPVITLQPVSQSVYSGGTVTFSAAASGEPTPTVQWQLSVDHGSTWANVAGLTSTSFTSGTVSAFENGWEVRAVFTNSAATATSDAATATVVPSVAPVVTTQPISQTVASGTTVTFSAAASGTPAPTVQWQVSVDGGEVWITVPGLTTPSISGAPTPFLNGWEFRALFTNVAGSAATNAATLTVT